MESSKRYYFKKAVYTITCIDVCFKEENSSTVMKRVLEN